MTDCMFCILRNLFFLGVENVFETKYITEEEEIYLRES
jgi:hypothetical protein